MDSGDINLLICVVAGRRIALAAAEVAEILPLVPMWRPPTLPRPMAGFVTVRGAAVAVVAPALLFDADAVLDQVGLYAHLVRLRDGPCLLVDRAEGMLSVAPAAIRPVDAAASFDGMVTGVADAAGGTAHVVALDRMLADGERMRIAALTAEAARRADEWAA
jgi:purine-binding chemotaxis protein CheW